MLNNPKSNPPTHTTKVPEKVPTQIPTLMKRKKPTTHIATTEINPFLKKKLVSHR